MPYLFNDPEEEDQKQNGQSQQGSGQGDSSQAASGTSTPQLSKDSGSAFGGAQGSSVQGAKPAGPSSSGSFVNLQKYLDANQDQSPANQIASNIGSQASAATDALGKAQSDFNTKAEGATTHYNQDLVDNALKDPTTAAGDSNQLSAFQKQLNANYGSGPKSLTDVSSYDPNEGTNAQSLVDQTKNQSGQFALLQRYFGGPNQYSGGEQGLDQMLLQSAPGSQQALTNIQSKYGNIAQQYGDAQKAAQGTYAADNSETQKAHDYAQSQLFGTNGKGGALNDLVGGVNTRVAALQNQSNIEVPKLQTALRNGDLTGLNQDEIKSLGNLGTAQYDYGLKPDDPNYFNFTSANNYTTGNVATQDEAARATALSKLGGVQNTYLPDASLAGSAPKSAYTFDAGKFNTDLAAHEKGVSDLEAQEKPYTDTANTAQGYQNFSSNDLLKDFQTAQDTAQANHLDNPYTAGNLANYDKYNWIQQNDPLHAFSLTPQNGQYNPFMDQTGAPGAVVQNYQSALSRILDEANKKRSGYDSQIMSALGHQIKTKGPA